MRNKMQTLQICSLALYISVFVTSGHSNIPGEQCRIETCTENQICNRIQEMKYKKMECIENREDYDPEKQAILSSLTAQYCKGTERYRECSVCFHNALQYHLNEMKELKNCVKQYQNSQFTLMLTYFKKFDTKTGISTIEEEWETNSPKPSNLDETLEMMVNMSTEEYRDCLGVFPAGILTEDKQLVLKIFGNSQKFTSIEEIQGFITLFLDAVRTKNESSAVSVECRHLLPFQLLSTYQRLMKSPVIIVRNNMLNGFQKLRADYCGKQKHADKCRACFQQADKIFMQYLFGRSEPVIAVRKDFEKIHTILTDCIKKYISNEYSSLPSLINNSERPETWNINFGNCWGDYRSNYEMVFKQNKELISLCEHNDPFVKTVATYYFGLSIYLARKGNREPDYCYYIQRSRILCAAGEMIKFFKDFGDNIEYEHHNDVLKYLAKRIGTCGRQYYYQP